jgi:TP901 family phage tail tape measure protein
MPSSISIPVSANTTALEQQIKASLANAGKNAKINLGSSSQSINALSQPLGRITGQADEFTKSMEAANARVFAFGASVGIITSVSNAFGALVKNTIAVEKSMTEINTVLGVSGSELDKFSVKLFDVAKNTGQTFQTVATGALELARQGLGAVETMKRINDALILSRLSGMDATQSVEGLTAAFNSFKETGITTSEILNKLVSVSQKYAVSERDLVEGLKRSAAVADQAGVSLDELIGVITIVQERTSRGGAVIGNAFKTIFARIQDQSALSDLKQLGIAVQDAAGKSLPAMQILKNVAESFNGLSQIQQADISKKLGSIQQLSNFLAAIKDLSSAQSQYGDVVNTSQNAADQAYQKNAMMNETLDSLINRVTLSAQELGATLGKIGLTDSAKNILGFFNSLLEGINSLLGEESGLGSFFRGIAKGLGNLITGPGLALFGAIIVKLSKDLVQFGFASLKSFFGIGKAAADIAAVERAINQALSTNVQLQREIIAAGGNRLKEANAIAAAMARQASSARIISEASASASHILYNSGVRVGDKGIKIKGSAAGYMPAISKESSDISRGVGGARSGDKPVIIPNFAFGGGKTGPMVAHTGEYIVPNFANGGSAIFNRNMVQTMGMPEGARKVGSAAGGFIPNFADKYFRFEGNNADEFQKMFGISYQKFIKENAGSQSPLVSSMPIDSAKQLFGYSRSPRADAMLFQGKVNGDTIKLAIASSQAENAKKYDTTLEDIKAQAAVNAGLKSAGLATEKAPKQRTIADIVLDANDFGGIGILALQGMKDGSQTIPKEEVWSNLFAKKGKKGVFENLVNQKYRKKDEGLPPVFGRAGITKDMLPPGQQTEKGNFVFNRDITKEIEDGRRGPKVQLTNIKTFNPPLIKKTQDFSKRINELLSAPLNNLAKQTFGDLGLGSNKDIEKALSSIPGGTSGGILSPAAEGSIFEAVTKIAFNAAKDYGDAFKEGENRPFDFKGEQLQKIKSGYGKLGGTIPNSSFVDAKRTGDDAALRSVFKKLINDPDTSPTAVSKLTKGYVDFYNANAASGYIPNYADPLKEALNRELDAGVSSSQIYVDKNPSLVSKQNPQGLMVANRRDEPMGGHQGISRALKEGKNPQTYGASRGFVPNFADFDITGTPLSGKKGRVVSFDNLNAAINGLVSALDLASLDLSMTNEAKALKNSIRNLAEVNKLDDKSRRTVTDAAYAHIKAEKDLEEANAIAASATKKQASSTTDLIGKVFLIQSALSGFTGILNQLGPDFERYGGGFADALSGITSMGSFISMMKEAKNQPKSDLQKFAGGGADAAESLSNLAGTGGVIGRTAGAARGGGKIAGAASGALKIFGMASSVFGKLIPGIGTAITAFQVLNGVTKMLGVDLGQFASVVIKQLSRSIGLVDTEAEAASKTLSKLSGETITGFASGGFRTGESTLAKFIGTYKTEAEIAKGKKDLQLKGDVTSEDIKNAEIKKRFEYATVNISKDMLAKTAGLTTEQLQNQYSQGGSTSLQKKGSKLVESGAYINGQYITTQKIENSYQGFSKLQKDMLTSFNTDLANQFSSPESMQNYQQAIKSGKSGKELDPYVQDLIKSGRKTLGPEKVSKVEDLIARSNDATSPEERKKLQDELALILKVQTKELKIQNAVQMLNLEVSQKRLDNLIAYKIALLDITNAKEIDLNIEKDLLDTTDARKVSIENQLSSMKSQRDLVKSQAEGASGLLKNQDAIKEAVKGIGGDIKAEDFQKIADLTNKVTDQIIAQGGYSDDVKNTIYEQLEPILNVKDQREKIVALIETEMDRLQKANEIQKTTEQITKRITAITEAKTLVLSNERNLKLQTLDLLKQEMSYQEKLLDISNQRFQTQAENVKSVAPASLQNRIEDISNIRERSSAVLKTRNQQADIFEGLRKDLLSKALEKNLGGGITEKISGATSIQDLKDLGPTIVQAEKDAAIAKLDAAFADNKIKLDTANVARDITIDAANQFRDIILNSPTEESSKINNFGLPNDPMAGAFSAAQSAFTPKTAQEQLEANYKTQKNKLLDSTQFSDSTLKIAEAYSQHQLAADELVSTLEGLDPSFKKASKDLEIQFNGLLAGFESSMADREKGNIALSGRIERLGIEKNFEMQAPSNYAGITDPEKYFDKQQQIEKSFFEKNQQLEFEKIKNEAEMQFKREQMTIENVRALTINTEALQSLVAEMQKNAVYQPAGQAGQATGSFGDTALSNRLVSFIKYAEEGGKPALSAYGDKGNGEGTPTVGWGSITMPNGQSVKMGDTVTADEADKMLIEELTNSQNSLLKQLGANAEKYSPQQKDALTSYTYNTGAGGLQKLISKAGGTEDPTKLLNTLRTNGITTAGGEYMPGLKNRRNDEFNLSQSPISAANIYTGDITAKLQAQSDAMIKLSDMSGDLTEKAKELAKGLGFVGAEADAEAVKLIKAAESIRNQQAIQGQAKETFSYQQRVNKILENPKSFAKGMDDGFLAINTQVAEFQGKIGEEIPQMFANGMSDAMQQAIEGGKDLDDILRDVSYNFIKELNSKMMSNLANQVVGSFGNASGGGTGLMKTLGFASGGQIKGGSGVKDDVPAMLMGGEYVIKKSAALKYGPNFLDAINNGTLGKFASGGKVGTRQDYYTPGTYEAKNLVGSPNLTNFASQAYTSTKNDDIMGGNGSASLSLSPESISLTNFGRTNGPQAEALRAAKGQSFDLVIEEYRAREQAKEQKKQADKAFRRQLIATAATMAITAGATGMGNAFNQAGQEGLTGIDRAAATVKGGWGGGKIDGVNAGGLKNLFTGRIALANISSQGQMNSYMSAYKEGEKLPNYLQSYTGTGMARRATGGIIPNTSGVDTVPAMLSGGEFIMNRAATQNIGAGNLQAMNSGVSPKSDDKSEELNDKLISKLDELIKATGEGSGIVINVDGKTGDSKEEKGGESSDAKQQLARQIKDAVLKVIQDEKRIGGQLRRGL